jgi:hypothetical protein
MPIYHGGRPTYGQAVGILMLETRFPRIPGGIGNAASLPFPALYKVVKGASPRRVIVERDPTLLQPFVDGARELEAAGVRAISTSCGFLALFHRQLARAVRVPMLTSALLQVPTVSRLVGGRPVGIMTAREASLDEDHFEGVGWSSRDFPVVVKGMDRAPLFGVAHQEDRLTMDFDQVRLEIVAVARELVGERPEVAAIVLEGVNMQAHAAAVQQAVDRPIFSILTLINLVQAGLERRAYEGYL